MADDDLNPPLGTTTPEIFLENVKPAGLMAPDDGKK